MKQVNDVEWSWTVSCPECGAQYDEYDEQVDDSGSRPVITCYRDDYSDGVCGCGCVFEVTCIEN